MRSFDSLKLQPSWILLYRLESPREGICVWTKKYGPCYLGYDATTAIEAADAAREKTNSVLSFSKQVVIPLCVYRLEIPNATPDAIPVDMVWGHGRPTKASSPLSWPKRPGQSLQKKFPGQQLESPGQPKKLAQLTSSFVCTTMGISNLALQNRFRFN